MVRQEEVDTLRAHMMSTGTHTKEYHANTAGYLSWIEKLRHIPGTSVDSDPSTWISNMLLPTASSRWSVHILEDNIKEASMQPEASYDYIGLCCIDLDDATSEIWSSTEVEEEEEGEETLQPIAIPHPSSEQTSADNVLYAKALSRQKTDFQPPHTYENGSNEQGSFSETGNVVTKPLPHMKTFVEDETISLAREFPLPKAPSFSTKVDPDKRQEDCNQPSRPEDQQSHGEQPWIPAKTRSISEKEPAIESGKNASNPPVRPLSENTDPLDERGQPGWDTSRIECPSPVGELFEGGGGGDGLPLTDTGGDHSSTPKLLISTGNGGPNGFILLDPVASGGYGLPFADRDDFPSDTPNFLYSTGYGGPNGFIMYDRVPDDKVGSMAGNKGRKEVIDQQPSKSTRVDSSNPHGKEESSGRKLEYAVESDISPTGEPLYTTWIQKGSSTATRANRDKPQSRVDRDEEIGYVSVDSESSAADEAPRNDPEFRRRREESPYYDYRQYYPPPTETVIRPGMGVPPSTVVFPCDCGTTVLKPAMKVLDFQCPSCRTLFVTQTRPKPKIRFHPIAGIDRQRPWPDNSNYECDARSVPSDATHSADEFREHRNTRQSRPSERNFDTFGSSASPPSNRSGHYDYPHIPKQHSSPRERSPRKEVRFSLQSRASSDQDAQWLREEAARVESYRRAELAAEQRDKAAAAALSKKKTHRRKKPVEESSNWQGALISGAIQAYRDRNKSK